MGHCESIQRRAQLGLENQDLIDWISYAPYMSKHYYQEYLNAVNKGSVVQLSAFEEDVVYKSMPNIPKESFGEERVLGKNTQALYIYQVTIMNSTLSLKLKLHCRSIYLGLPKL